MKKQLLAVSIFLLCMLHTAAAVRVTRLYQAAMAVVSQSAAERNHGLPAGLAQVLVKVSGNNEVPNNPKIKAELNSAGTFIQEFSYSAAPFKDNAKAYILQLNFDPEGVNQLLRSAGIPIWAQNRPLLLVWLDNEAQGQSPDIITSDSVNPVSFLFKQNLDRRGVPVIFPEMDMTDLNVMTVNDIATMAIPTLANAAKRYGSDGMLVGHIVQDAQGYKAEWKLVIGDNQWSWNTKETSMNDTLTAIADHLADTLGSRYAVLMTDTAQTRVSLKITDVSEADDFLHLMNYLKHLTAVTDVQLVRVSGSDVILDISLRGTADAFMQGISPEKKLTPVSNDGTLLTYQWNH